MIECNSTFGLFALIACAPSNQCDLFDLSLSKNMGICKESDKANFTAKYELNYLGSTALAFVIVDADFLQAMRAAIQTDTRVLKVKIEAVEPSAAIKSTVSIKDFNFNATVFRTVDHVFDKTVGIAAISKASRVFLTVTKSMRKFQVIYLTQKQPKQV
ncbi:hypothetical protein N9370_01820 [Paracoccaceae bacterium]|nr:hypothetical protein [Paracoccaceae bacterium]